MEMEFNQISLLDVNGTESPSLGNQKGFGLDSTEQKNIRLDRLQTVLNRLVFFIVYWGVLQIAFIFFVGILYIMNIVLQWKKTVLNGKNLGMRIQ
jgi:hypothetical protein